ncbi:MAG: substrate-binding domain-containing protein [Candidatus Brocadiia bacterium]
MKQHIVQTIRNEITGGERNPGSRLPSVEILARRFGTTEDEVIESLEKLERLNYLEPEGEDGTYLVQTPPDLTLSHTVAVGLGRSRHVWGDLAELLAAMFQEDERLPVVFDVEDQEGRQQLERLGGSQVEAFVIRGTRGFPYRILQNDLFSDKIILGIADWEGPVLPGMLRVLSDYEAGARLLARHLFNRGHRRLLAVAPGEHHFQPVLGDDADENQKFVPRRPGKVLLDEWKRLGGEYETLIVELGMEVLPSVPEDAYRRCFGGDSERPAVFSTMDVLSFAIQRWVREQRPEIFEEIYFAGFYDSPWSRAGHPPFTSVNLRLEELAVRAHRMLQKALNGEEVRQKLEVVKPRLVIRKQGN